jgi:hypothetical protein
MLSPTGSQQQCKRECDDVHLRKQELVENHPTHRDFRPSLACLHITEI